MTQREAWLHLHRARGEAAFVQPGTLRRPPARHPHRPKAAWASSTQGLERELGHSRGAAAVHFFMPCWFQGHEAAQAGANWALSPSSPDVQHPCNGHASTAYRTGLSAAHGKARCVWSFSWLVLADYHISHLQPPKASRCFKTSPPVHRVHRVQRKPPRKPSALWKNSLLHQRALLFAHFVPCCLSRAGHDRVQVFPGHDLGSNREPCVPSASQVLSQLSHWVLLHQPGEAVSHHPQMLLVAAPEGDRYLRGRSVQQSLWTLKSFAQESKADKSCGVFWTPLQTARLKDRLPPLCHYTHTHTPCPRTGV